MRTRAPVGSPTFVSGKTLVGGADPGGVVAGAFAGAVLAGAVAVRVGEFGFSTTRIGSRSAGSTTIAELLADRAAPPSADTDSRPLVTGGIALDASAELVEDG